MMTEAEARKHLTPPTLEPGLHENLRDLDYHNMPEVSQSRLKKLARSAAHLKEEMDNPKPRTPSQTLGSAFHDAVLLPDVFEGRYGCAGQCEAYKKDGARCVNEGKVSYDGRWFCGVKGHDPGGIPDEIEILTAVQWEACRRMADRVLTHEDTQDLLAGKRKELSAIWIDEETGLRSKGRFDVISDCGQVVTDAKTTKDASKEGFPWEIEKWGYHQQGGFYVPGANVLGENADYFAIIAVENFPPFEVNVFELRGEAIDAGISENRELLKKYKKCLDEGEWPGYPTGITQISLPPRAFNKIERRVKGWQDEAEDGE